MFTVKKGNMTQVVQDDIQLAAFVKSGWEQVGNAKKSGEKEESLDIDALKAEADSLGVKYMQNIGAVKLSERIAEFKANAEA